MSGASRPDPFSHPGALFSFPTFVLTLLLCRLDDIVNAIDDGSKGRRGYSDEPDFSDGGPGGGAAGAAPMSMDEPTDFQVRGHRIPPAAPVATAPALGEGAER